MLPDRCCLQVKTKRPRQLRRDGGSSIMLTFPWGIWSNCFGRQGVTLASKANRYVLLAHDWCKIDYKNHTRKADLRQITHQTDIGYDMTVGLLVDADNGNPLAPMQMHLKTADAFHSTAINPPEVDAHHLDQLSPTMRESDQWGLGRKVVHVIDREADSLGRLRSWDADGHLFLVRSDDRRVLWGGGFYLISEIVEHFDSEILFEPVGEARHRGKAVMQEVAEAEIVLHRPHSEVIDGEKRQVKGERLPMRLVITRLLDEDDYIVAQWTLLTNVFDEEISAHQIALWYYWRWLIETFFKLLKSHGKELEKWQQQSGEAIARRILVASMACVAVWALQQDASPKPKNKKNIGTTEWSTDGVRSRLYRTGATGRIHVTALDQRPADPNRHRHRTAQTYREERPALRDTGMRCVDSDALAGGPLWGGMAWFLIAGLTLAALLTLIVIPVLYSLLFGTIKPQRESSDFVGNTKNISA